MPFIIGSYESSYFGIELPRCLIKKRQDKFCHGLIV